MHPDTWTTTPTRPITLAKTEHSYSPIDHRTDAQIISVACEIIGVCSGLTIREILGTARTKRIMDTRHLLRYYLRECLHWTYPRIGKATHCDHSTAISSVRRATDLFATNDAQWLRMAVAAIDVLHP